MYFHTSLTTQTSIPDLKCVGHGQLMQVLRTAAQDVVAGHAFLFIGKDTPTVNALAQWFAALTICSQQGSDPCGQCSACRSAQRGNSQQFIALHPNDRGLYTVGDVRELRASLMLSVPDGMPRVVVIAGAEGLQPASANALLKLLEEPHARCRFVLTTSDERAVLPTIRSRSSLYRVQPVATPALLTALHDAKVSAKVAVLASKLAPGQLGRAYELVQADLQPYEALVQGIQTFQTSSLRERLQYVDKLLQDGEADSRHTVRQFLALWGIANPHQHVDLILETAQALMTNCSPKTLFQAFAVQCV